MWRQLFQKLSAEELAISVVSVQELYQGKSSAEGKKEKDLQIAISLVEVLPYSYQEAVLAGKIVRESNYAVGFVDAAIAATTILNNAQLVTLNPKDFMGIKDLQLFDLKTLPPSAR